MKKYYLHIGTENSGPFDLEELKIRRITKKTPVWFEGLENWKYAEDIEELKGVFVVTPPPIHSFKSQQAIPKAEEKTQIDLREEEAEEIEDEISEAKILGVTKNVFFIGLTFILLLIATLIFNFYQDKRDRELDKINHKTEIENHQYDLQQKEIEEQKIALAEQEKKDAEQAVVMNKQSISDRIIEIEKLLTINQSNLENAKDKLQDTSGFKLLRTAAQKQQQMDSLKNEINSYLKEIARLKNESDVLKLKLEKIQ